MKVTKLVFQIIYKNWNFEDIFVDLVHCYGNWYEVTSTLKVEPNRSEEHFRVTLFGNFIKSYKVPSHQLNSKTNDLVLLSKTISRYWNCFLSPVVVGKNSYLVFMLSVNKIASLCNSYCSCLAAFCVMIVSSLHLHIYFNNVSM